MEAQIDSHQWASKIETQGLLSGKSDLSLEAHAQTADDEPTPCQPPLTRRIASLFKWAVVKGTCT